MGDSVGVGEYRYSRKGVAVFLGIVFGLAKDGKKKCAPVGGGTVARGVVGGDGEVEAFHLFCWGTISAFWVPCSSSPSFYMAECIDLEV